MASFQLSAVLKGHEDDVRAVNFPSPNSVISASRDATVRVWTANAGPPPAFDDTILSHGTAFVNAVAYLPPSSDFPNGLVISGGQDTIIEAKAPDKSNSEALLVAHSGNVCALDVDPAGKFILSGSWDAEARVWQVGGWSSQIVLKDHEGSVWGVLAYDSNTLITACADKIIRVFSASGKLQRRITGSEGVVRALARLPKAHATGADFASTGNDGVIRFWTLSGKQVATAHGHDNYVYSLAVLPTGELVTSGEDRTVRIWQGTECIQTITLPALSIWSVAVNSESGDIVTGDSNKMVHVWTRDSERIASAEVLSAFKESVKGSVIPQEAAAPNIDKSKLPGPDFIKNKSGTKEGQVQMIHEANGDVNAYQWSSGQQEWIMIGAVVSSATGGSKKDYLGVDYDYVFDVDIKEGAPPLKLPYNVTQNPYDAATKFITDNELPGAYLDQVAQFIITNTQGATLETTQQQGPADPWGSDSRYRPGDGTSSKPPPPRAQPTAAPKILPQTEYLSIVVGRYDQMQKKIKELNTALISSGQKGISLNPTELDVLDRVVSRLSSPAVASSSRILGDGLNIAVMLITSWPYADRLPGLDLLRLLCVSEESAAYIHPSLGSIVDVLISAVAPEGQEPAENHVMMAVRAFGNLFSSSLGRELANTEFSKIQNLTGGFVAKTSNRNLLIAAVTIYINYAVYFTSNGKAEEAHFEEIVQILDSLTKIVSTQKDAEVVYRALVAIGTLLSIGDEVKSAAKDVYDVSGGIAKAEAAVKGDARIKNVTREIKALLTS